ncbi:MAG: hypothetical protein ACR2IP_05360 [Solirubrobacteraceae bacterium]
MQRRSGQDIRKLTILCASLLCLAALLAGSGTALAAPAPANDARANFQNLGGLPASVTGATDGSTLEPSEPPVACGSISGSVWYGFDAQSTGRIAVQLKAHGDLDAIVDVFVRQRSQTFPVTCGRTDANGEGAVHFRATRGTSYLIRVAQLGNAAAGSFALNVFAPSPPASYPGPRLAAGGRSGSLNRLGHHDDAWSARLRVGVSYKVNLFAPARSGSGDTGRVACPRVGIYKPGNTDFSSAADITLRCNTYRLFTPGPGQGGLYSFHIRADNRARGRQRYHIQVAPAGPGDTTPGIFFANGQHVHSALHGAGIAVVRIYRFDVTSLSNTALQLSAPQTASFSLRLLTDHGRELSCACGGSGDQSITRVLRPGSYYAVVQTRDGTGGRFTLVRLSRTITHTGISFNGAGNAGIRPGGSATVGIGVSPGVSGPAVVILDRLDPLFGWQFLRTVHVRVSGGAASFAFSPPTEGHYRAMASFGGTHTAAPSLSRFAFLDVSSPLH